MSEDSPGKPWDRKPPTPEEAIEMLRRLTFLLRDNPDISIDQYFAYAVSPFYDTMWKWNPPPAIYGDILYRLSDYVPQEQREIIEVYPDPNGTLMLESTSLA